MKMILDTDSYLKSKLKLEQYFILQILVMKNKVLFDKQKKNSLEELVYLCENDYIKYAGYNTSFNKSTNWFLRNDFDLDDFVIFHKSKSIFEDKENEKKIEKIDNWIQKYRLKFKGIKPGSMGDPTACLKKMQLFLQKNPKYTKENILEAASKYISNTEPIYTMQADYFISKVDNNKIAASKLLVVLEEIELGEFIDNNSSNLNTMI